MRRVGTHRALGLAAALFGLAIAALVVAERNRLWRHLQRDYLADELQRAQRQLEEAERILAEAGQATATESSEDPQPELAALEEAARRDRRLLQLAERRFDAARRDLEAATSSETDALLDELRQRRREVEGLRELSADSAARLAAYRGIDTAEDVRLTEARDEVDRWRSRVGALRPSPIFRLPVVELFDPRLRIHQLTRGAGEPERCATCHLGAIEPPASELPQPFSAHPRPELFLTADSPHPYPLFGCTSCHGGDGRRLGFDSAGHLPASDEEAARWRELWNWRDTTSRSVIRGGDVADASCAACHGDTAVAPRRELGRQLATALGCAGCHSTASEPRWHRGPPLTRLAEKTTAAWLERWLADPAALHPATTMPVALAGEDAEAHALRQAIVRYLWATSRGDIAPSAPRDGDPERGATLFARVGCAGCHVVEAASARVAYLDRLERLHGPSLAGAGEKLRPGWVFRLLRQRRGERPLSAMPDLRLSESEAADLTAFVGSLGGESGRLEDETPGDRGDDETAIDGAANAGDVEPGVRDRLLLAALEEDTTLEAAQARLDAMPERRRTLALGEHALRRHGCTGCHAIAGIDAPAPVPHGDLDERALIATVRTGRADWHSRDAKRPAPNFRLAPDEARALALDLLARRTRPASTPDPLSRARKPDARKRGADLVERFGCRGCHLLGGRGGDLGPPLDGAGARLRPEWTFAYLDDPSAVTVRPWLDLRMPSYDLGAAERQQLVDYLASRDAAAPHVDPPPPTDRTPLAVGRAAFAMLQCERCHLGHEPAPVDPAPDYRLARERLRPDWIVDWLLDPKRLHAGTAMPAFFTASGGELDSSYLAGSLAAPMFRLEQDRVVARLGSDEAAADYLADPHRVAEALRDYVLSLGE